LPPSKDAVRAKKSSLGTTRPNMQPSKEFLISLLTWKQMVTHISGKQMVAHIPWEQMVASNP
jgi:hypothetical protein